MCWIQQQQHEHRLPTPVIVYTDRLFGSVETCKKYYPNICFIMSCCANRAVYGEILKQNLEPGEYCAATFSHGVIVVCNDGGNTFVNVSSAHTAETTQRNDPCGDVDVGNEGGNPEIETMVESKSRKYIYTKEELDSLRIKDLAPILQNYNLPRSGPEQR